jgi:hypothetical protein
MYFVAYLAELLEEDPDRDILKTPFVSENMEMYDSPFIKNLLEVQSLELDEIQLSQDEMEDTADIMRNTFLWDMVVISLYKEQDKRTSLKKTMNIEHDLQTEMNMNYKVLHAHAHTYTRFGIPFDTRNMHTSTIMCIIGNHHTKHVHNYDVTPKLNMNYKVLHAHAHKYTRFGNPFDTRNMHTFTIMCIIGNHHTKHVHNCDVTPKYTHAHVYNIYHTQSEHQIGNPKNKHRILCT